MYERSLIGSGGCGHGIVVIGGASGTGKTALCADLAASIPAMIVKQKAALIAAGAGVGLGWPDVAEYHDQLIEEAAKNVLVQLGQSGKQYLLIDCHYAIRVERALRPTRVETDLYIQDIDSRFIRCLGMQASKLFLLLETHPQVSVRRIRAREGAIPLDDDVIRIIAEDKAAEFAFWERVVSTERLLAADLIHAARIDTEQSLRSVSTQATELISYFLT